MTILPWRCERCRKRVWFSRSCKPCAREFFETIMRSAMEGFRFGYLRATQKAELERSELN